MMSVAMLSRRFVLPWCIILAQMALFGQDPGRFEHEEGAVMEEVIQLIKDSIRDVQTNRVRGLPPLEKALVTLQTTTTLDLGFQLNLLILTVGSRSRTETGSRILIELQPPVERSRGARPTDAKKLETALAQAIHLAQLGLLNANRSDPRLDLNRVEIEIKFAVKKERSASGESQQLLPLGLKGTAKLPKNKIHTLNLIFGHQSSNGGD